MDGGTVWNVNIQSPINYCLDQGYEEKDIILDVLICSQHPQVTGEVTKNAIENWMTAYHERKYYVGTDSLSFAKDAFPEVETRYYFEYDETVCPPNSELNFNNSTTWCMQELGRSDAQNALNQGQEMINKSLDEWLEDQELQVEQPNVLNYLRKVFGY